MLTTVDYSKLLRAEVEKSVVSTQCEPLQISSEQLKIVMGYIRTMPSINCLPGLACIASGGDVEMATPLTVSWSMFVLACDIYDDIQDDNVNQYPMSVPQLLSFSLWLLALSYQSFCELEVSDQTYREVEAQLRSAILKATLGQLCSLPDSTHMGVSSPETYLKTLIAKTANPFATYMRCGARIATDREAVGQSFYEYGFSVGIIVQLVDDLNDLLEDIAQKTYTLPVLDGLSKVGHPQNTRLQNLLNAEQSEKNISEIIKILNKMGALDRVRKLVDSYNERSEIALQSISNLLSNEAAKLFTL